MAKKKPPDGEALLFVRHYENSFRQRRIHRYHGEETASRTAWDIPAAFPRLDRLCRNAEKLGKRPLCQIGRSADFLYFPTVIFPDRLNLAYAFVTHGREPPAHTIHGARCPARLPTQCRRRQAEREPF